MNYPCGMIQDLLPLYVDGVATEASKAAVEGHLPICTACQAYYEALLSREPFAEKTHHDQEDQTMADSLKKVKEKINKKMRNTILCAVAAVAVLLGGYYLLSQVPLKMIDPADVAVTVEQYAVEDLVTVDEGSGEGKLVISADEMDTAGTYSLRIPAMPETEVAVTKSILEKYDTLSVLSVTCPYFIREIHYADKEADSVMYIEAFKTTVLNNKAPEHWQTTKNFEFRDIEQVIFLQNGQETVLWSK